MVLTSYRECDWQLDLWRLRCVSIHLENYHKLSYTQQAERRYTGYIYSLLHRYELG
jgi:hypothetical protein